MNNEDRVLAIAPYSGGLGYAVIEWPLSFVAGGVKNVPVKHEDKIVMNLVRLLTHYRPTTIVLADGGDSQTRRAAQLKNLLCHIVRHEATAKVPVRTYSRNQVRDLLNLDPKATKHDIVMSVAMQLTELAPRFPSRRRCGHKEDYHMPMFEAVVLALAHLSK